MGPLVLVVSALQSAFVTHPDELAAYAGRRVLACCCSGAVERLGTLHMHISIYSSYTYLLCNFPSWVLAASRLLAGRCWRQQVPVGPLDTVAAPAHSAAAFASAGADPRGRLLQHGRVQRQQPVRRGARPYLLLPLHVQGARHLDPLLPACSRCALKRHAWRGIRPGPLPSLHVQGAPCELM